MFCLLLHKRRCPIFFSVPAFNLVHFASNYRQLTHVSHTYTSHSHTHTHTLTREKESTLLASLNSPSTVWCRDEHMGMSTSDHTKAETKKTINSQLSTAQQNLVLQPLLCRNIKSYFYSYAVYTTQHMRKIIRCESGFVRRI